MTRYGIRAIKAAVGIPVIANGDITSPEKALEVLSYTAADAVMIGRAAQGRPWIFREINHFMETGRHLPAPGPLEIGDILSGHLRQLYEFYGEYTGVRVARKHIAWYSKRQRNGNVFRQHINRLESAEAQLQYVRDYFAVLSEQQGLAA
jgi:tRNA-dihydrouridine synthase B